MRIAVPTNDHISLAEDIFQARGIMVYMIEENRIRSRLFRYFQFKKFIQQDGLLKLQVRRFAEFLHKCDWLVVGKMQDGLDEIAREAEVRVRLTKYRLLSEIQEELIHLNTIDHVYIKKVPR